MSKVGVYYRTLAEKLRFAYPRDNSVTAVGLATLGIKTQSEISHVDVVCLVL